MSISALQTYSVLALEVNLLVFALVLETKMDTVHYTTTAQRSEA